MATAKSKALRPVIVTTEHRAVFFGNGNGNGYGYGDG